MSQIKEYRLQNGTPVTAYVPDNVSDDTPIFFYSYIVGSDHDTDPIWKGMEEDMLRYNGDAIIAIPHDRQLQIGTGNVATHKYQRLAIETYQTIQSDLGINSTQFINGGFSAGFGYATRTLAHYLQENPNAERQVLLAVDGVVKDNVNLQQSELDALRDNGTIIISFTQQKNHDHQYEKFASTGLPILYLVDESIPEETPDEIYWGIHDKVAKDYFDKGFYDQLINFALGKGDIELPEGYHLRYYDPKTGQIIKVTPEEAAQLMNVSTVTGLNQKSQLALASLGDITIKSEDKTLENHINSIRGKIRNTTFLKSNFNEASFQSTTKVPTELPSIVNNYFESTMSLLNSIARKTVAIAKIAGEIEIQDNQLANQALDLNSAEPLYKVAEPLADEPIQELTDENLLESSPQTENLLADSAQNLGTNQNAGTSNSNSESPFTNQTGSTASQNTYPSTNDSSQNNNYSEPQPSYGGGGYTGGGGGGTGGGSANRYPEPQPETSPQTAPPTEPSTESATQPETTPSTEVVTEVPTEVITSPEEMPIEENFPEYEEIYSDEDQLVYNYNDEYKVVVHHDGENIKAIEHYYDYETKEAAIEAVEKLQTEYENVENFDRIIQNDRYVKVLFKEEMYNDTNLEQIKEKYQELDEVIQNIDSTENIEKLERLPETESTEITEYEEKLEEI